MSPPSREDWNRIRQVFEAALAQPAERRQSFVAEACGGEPGILDQVDKLLASHDRAADFLETPAARLVSDGPHASLTGRQIGPYHLTAHVGQGGMGDVYRARDARLQRTVAIKVLRSQAVADRPARDRFEREARAVAALNHPHICTLYDIGTHDGTDFLVMEFLEGETLATRLQRGAIPLAQVLPLAIQIASALDRAHRSGIVHRDLKPRNIMLTPAGAKLLDFGLAKTTASAFVEAPGGTAVTELTAPGTILGTLHYMAPEQLEGRVADSRTDLFAFGCVLYEMVTGKKAFDARSSASLLTAIMAQSPTPVRVLQPGVSPGLEYAIGRCLEKDPDERWQTARDLLAELKRSEASGDAAPAATGARRWRWPWVALPVGILALVAGVMMAAPFLRPTPPPPTTWLSILPPPGGFDLSPDPVVSPNARYVVFKAEAPAHTSLLWLKELDRPGVRPLPGTDGVAATTAPFWSPDSRSIGFFARGQLKRIDIDGAAAQVLAPAAESHGGTWTTSGVIIFDSGNRLLHSVPASGGAPTPVAGTGPGQVRLFPHALPDGRHYLFTSRNVNGLGQGIYVASLDEPEVRRVSDAWSRAAYASGYLLFGRQGTLFAQAFDLDRLVTTGDPRSLAEGVGNGCCTPLSSAFSAVPSVLAFWSGTFQTRTQIRWIGRDGRELETVGDSALQSGLALSPDGRRIALERQNPLANSVDIWLLDLASRSAAARFTLDGNAITPVWSPGGDRLLVMYRSRGLVALPLRGSKESVFFADPMAKWVTDWSSVSGHIAFLDATSGFRLWTLAADGRSQPVLYREGPFALAMLRFHPRGGWVAYLSEESGHPEIYVDSFPTAGHKIRVSTSGGAWPVWRRDGTELYYIAADRSLMAVAVQVGPEGIHVATPTRLFEAPALPSDWSRMQVVPNSDGSRFLFNARVEDRTPVGLTVISNWPALLTSRQ